MKEGDQNKTFKHPPGFQFVVFCVCLCVPSRKRRTQIEQAFFQFLGTCYDRSCTQQKSHSFHDEDSVLYPILGCFFFHPFLLQYKREAMEMIISSHEVFPLLLERASRSSGQLEFRNLFLSGLWVAQGQRVNSLTGSPPPTLLHSVHTLSLQLRVQAKKETRETSHHSSLQEEKR